MTLVPRRTFLASGAAAALPGVAWAEPSWPARPVTIIVPYGPGASNDIFTRALGNAMSQRLGQPFIVENRPGASGFTGINAVSRAAPDGATLVQMPNSIAGLKPILHVDVDPLRTVTPIAVFARAPTALVVPGALPVKTVAEFVAYAKANPGRVFYGYAGTGTTQQQHAEMFNDLTGARVKGVNYKGSADAQIDLLAGRVQAMFVTVASTLGQIRSGELRLLAYTDDDYPPGGPPGPTMKEAGVDGMGKAQIWWGLFGPPRMAPELVGTINRAVNAAVSDPAVTALFAQSGAIPVTDTPERFAAVIGDENALVADFARAIAATR